MIVAGCSSNADNAKKDSASGAAPAGAAQAGGSANLTGAGATFPYPIYSKWFTEYAAKTGVKINYQPIGGGPSTYYWETHALLLQPGMTHVASVIANGIFERFPKMMFIVIECGVAWLPAILWRLDANWRALQPMAKGTTAANNVQLLKWCRQFGVRQSWSLLWGFPGGDDAWYADMARLPPLLHHLQPAPPLRLNYHRYSPYFSKAASFGIDLKPAPSFRWVYPLDEQSLADQVYYFDDRSPADRGGHVAARDAARRPGLHALSARLTE